MRPRFGLQSHQERHAEFLQLRERQQDAQAVCDRCLQPIDGRQFEQNLEGLQAIVVAAGERHETARAEAQLSQASDLYCRWAGRQVC